MGPKGKKETTWTFRCAAANRLYTTNTPERKGQTFVNTVNNNIPKYTNRDQKAVKLAQRSFQKTTPEKSPHHYFYE